MSDKHVFFSILGGFFFCGIAMLLVGTLGSFAKLDSGDDGIGLILIGCAVIAGIIGFIVMARWLHKRFERQI